MCKKNKYKSLIVIFIAQFILLAMVSSCKGVAKKTKKDIAYKNEIIKKIATLSKTNILVCAHRAFHRNAPENSSKSIMDAIKEGIDFAEIDIRTTKDSVLVLMHDATIDRTTTGKGFVKDFTYKELQQFYLKMGDSVTNQKIPLLIDILKLAKDKITPDLDLKAVNYMQLYTMLKSLDMQHKVISFIGERKKVQEMVSIDSLYAVLPLVKTKERMLFYQKHTLSPLQHFTNQTFTKDNMQWIHKKGELVFVNTLWDEDNSFIQGDTKAMDSVVHLKPAIIQTNYPKLLLKYLQKKGLHP